MFFTGNLLLMPGIKKQPKNHESYLGCSAYLVPGTGLEPAQPYGHWSLKPARLPISPSGPDRNGVQK